MSADWSEIELNLIIADYFSMLTDELSRKVVNKTSHRTSLQKILNNRSEGSVEFKHQNISAVLIELELPYIRGYKPRWNFQKKLKEKIVEYLAPNRKPLESTFRLFADEPITNPIYHQNFSKIIESPPDAKIVRDPSIVYSKRPIKINYLEREQNNATLGNQGEELVFAYEKWRLVQAGNEALAGKIEWVSKIDDGAGFDILSKNPDGTDKYIEVKTTKLGKDSPIFFSKNEYDFSLKNSSNYNLYRVFNFSEDPKIFSIQGSFDSFCVKEALQYKGIF